MSESRRKVCFVVTDAVSFNALCKGQLEYFAKKTDWDITLLCGGDAEEFEKLHSRNVGRVVNMGLVRRPSPVRDLRSFLLLCWFFLRNRFDLVVYSTPKALLIASAAAFISGQRTRVAIIRGRVYENYRGVLRWCYGVLDKIALIFSQRVVFISRSLRDAYVGEQLVDDQKAVVLGQGSSNGVSVSDFRPVTSVERAALREQLKLGWCASDTIIVMVGRICRDKGIIDISRVVELVKDWRVKFLLVGKIEDELGEQTVSKFLSEFPDRVKYFDKTSDVKAFFQCADLHLFLTHREGFGNVAIEAAACGVPTIAFDVVGVRDSVSKGCSGELFARNDIKGIADFIENYAGAQDSVTFRGARDWAVEGFACEQVWENHRRFYEGCMQQRS